MGTDSTKKTVSGHVVAKLDLRSGELAALQGPEGIAIREATTLQTLAHILKVGNSSCRGEDLSYN